MASRTVAVVVALLTLHAASPTPRANAQTAGLVAAWGLDEGSGTTAADASVNGHTATLVGGPLWVAGHLGGAVSLDGVNDYVETGLTTNLSAWTVSAWVYSPATPAYGLPSGPIHRSNNFHLNWNHHSAAFRGAIALRVAGAWHAARFGSLAANTWYYLAATYDGQTLNAYTNGVLVTANPNPSGPPDPEPNSLKLGRHANLAQFFRGTIDNVRIYGRALSLAEIQADMNAPVGGPAAPRLILVQPADGSTFFDPTVNVTYSASGDLTGVDHVHFRLDSNSEVMDVDFDGSYQFANVPAGTHVLQGHLVRADHAKIDGSEASVSFTTVATGDTTPPTVEITAPESGATVSGTITLTATASDDQGVPGVQFLVDGQSLGPEDTATPFSVSWNTSAASNGSHTLTARARDAAGNETVSSAVTVTVSNSRSSDPSLIGQWSAPFSTPVIAAHLMLLRTGEVLMWDVFRNGFNAYRWNPISGGYTFVPSASNIFCSGQTFLADGRPIVLGGHKGAFNGIADVNVFDPVSSSWSLATPMAFQRWYPTATSLPDGRVIVVSGAEGCVTCIQDIPEVYDPTLNSWTQLTSARLTMPLYPHMFVLPDGRILYASATEAVTDTQVLDLATQTWSMIDPVRVPGGSSVMYRPGVILKAGSPGAPGRLPIDVSESRAFVLDMNQSALSWRQVASMVFPRTYHTLTALPDGTVLVTSGSQGSEPDTTPVYAAEIWDPSTEQWSVMGSGAVARSYHATALLLPDARVLVAGSGGCCRAPNQRNAELFSPPYLFKGPRPTITSVSTTIQYGAQFSIATPDSGAIASVALVRFGAVTHQFDHNQRYVPLAFVPAATAVTAIAPANANLAPPGDYMLFVVSAQGVPSIARIVTLR